MEIFYGVLGVIMFVIMIGFVLTVVAAVKLGDWFIAIASLFGLGVGVFTLMIIAGQLGIL